MTLSFVVPVLELLINVLVTGIITAVTITLSIRAARKETLRTLRANGRSELRARRERERELAAEVARVEHRERALLAGVLLKSVREMFNSWDWKSKQRAKMTATDGWQGLLGTFETSPLPDAYKVYKFADLRMRVLERADVTSFTAVQFTEAAFFVEDIRQAALVWVESGRLSDDVVEKLVAFEREEKERLRARGEEMYRRIVAIDET